MLLAVVNLSRESCDSESPTDGQDMWHIQGIAADAGRCFVYQDISGSPLCVVPLFVVGSVSPHDYFGYIEIHGNLPFRKKQQLSLVGGLVAINFIFPYIGLLIIPIDEVIFFRGVAQPPTRSAFTRGTPSLSIRTLRTKFCRESSHGFPMGHWSFHDHVTGARKHSAQRKPRGIWVYAARDFNMLRPVAFSVEEFRRRKDF